MSLVFSSSCGLCITGRIVTLGAEDLAGAAGTSQILQNVDGASEMKKITPINRF